MQLHVKLTVKPDLSWCPHFTLPPLYTALPSGHKTGITVAATQREGSKVAMKCHWNQAKGLLTHLKSRDPLAMPGHKGQRFAQLSNTYLHKGTQDEEDEI